MDKLGTQRLSSSLSAKRVEAKRIAPKFKKGKEKKDKTVQKEARERRQRSRGQVRGAVPETVAVITAKVTDSHSSHKAKRIGFNF